MKKNNKKSKNINKNVKDSNEIWSWCGNISLWKLKEVELISKVEILLSRSQGVSLLGLNRKMYK